MHISDISKVLILSPYYIPGFGYQEVFVAHAFASMRKSVYVVATPCVPTYMVASEHDFVEKDPTIVVRYIEPKFRRRETYIPDVDAIVNCIVDIEPDIIVAFNVPSGYVHRILRHALLVNVPKIVFFSDITNFSAKESSLYSTIRSITNKLIGKDRWYASVFSTANVLVANTPETLNILMSKSRSPEQKKKMVGKALGVNSGSFFYNCDLREKKRRELGLKDNHVMVITSTKVIAWKSIDVLIDRFSYLASLYDNIRYYIVGGMGDEYQASLEQMIADRGLRIVIVPRQSRQDLNEYYNAADISLWHSPTHSIQESLFVGVSALLPDTPIFSHLLNSDKSGKYFSKIEDIRSEDIERLADSAFRQSRIESASFLSYDSILSDVVALI